MLKHTAEKPRCRNLPEERTLGRAPRNVANEPMEMLFLLSLVPSWMGKKNAERPKPEQETDKEKFCPTVT